MRKKPKLRPVLLRITLVMLLLVVCLQDWPAARVWQSLEALPDFDHAAEAQRLRAGGRHDEALMVAAAGAGTLPPEQAEPLLWLGHDIQRERDGLAWRGNEVLHGVLRGTGDSREALTGAIVSDLLVFGDVRDLVIQSGRGVRGEPVDPVIVALSGAGIALTAAPLASTGAAVLKVARKTGALSSRFGQQLMRMSRRAVQQRDATRLRAVATDAGTLHRAAGGAPALRILRHVDHADDLARSAAFVQRPGGVFALWVSGRPGVRWLRRNDPEAAALLLRASRKGPEGAALLMRSGGVLLKPHAVIGLVKGIYKGNIPAWIEPLLRQHAVAIVAALAAWLLLEFLLLGHRMRRRTAIGTAATRGAAPAAALAGMLLLVGPSVSVHAAESAPAWSLQTPEGETVRFPQDMQGQPAVLFFWPSWCPYSRALQPYVQAIWEDYREAGIQLWSINILESRDPREVMRERNLDFPLLVDGDALIAPYGITRTPWLLVVDSEQRVVYRRPAEGSPGPVAVAQRTREALNALLGEEAAVPLPESYPAPYDRHLREHPPREPADFDDATWQRWVSKVVAESEQEAVAGIDALGAVPDGRSAIEHARRLWAERWGEARVRSRAPYRSFRQGEIWVVTTAGGAARPGDGFLLVLRRDDGRVLRLSAPQDDD